MENVTLMSKKQMPSPSVFAFASAAFYFVCEILHDRVEAMSVSLSIAYDFDDWLDRFMDVEKYEKCLPYEIEDRLRNILDTHKLSIGADIKASHGLNDAGCLIIASALNIPLKEYDTAIVYSTHGQILMDVKTGKVLGVEEIDPNNPALPAVKTFDVVEFRQYYTSSADKLLQGGIDILNIGYWVDSGNYEPPVEYDIKESNWRVRLPSTL